MRHPWNVNMLGAFLHIFSDTLRTLAIFIAAMISSITNIPTALTDAYAAVIVAFSIILVSIPLLNEIVFQIVIYMNEEWEDSLIKSICIVILKFLYYFLFFGFLRKDSNIMNDNDNEYQILLNRIKKGYDDEENISLII